MIEQKGLCPTWGPCTLIQRLAQCRIMLYQHGILTDAERERADKRIDKKEREIERAAEAAYHGDIDGDLEGYDGP